MHRAATCACFCASHAYAMHASGRNNAAGFVLSKRIYRCVWYVRRELEGGIPPGEVGRWGIQKWVLHLWRTMSTVCASQPTQLPVRPPPPEHAAEHAPCAKGEEDESGSERVVVVRFGERSGARVCDAAAKGEEQTWSASERWGAGGGGMKVCRA